MSLRGVFVKIGKMIWDKRRLFQIALYVGAIVIIAVIPALLTKDESLAGNFIFIINMALLCICQVIYKLLLYLFGVHLTYKERRIGDIHILSTLFLFSVYVLISAAFRLHYALPLYIISSAAFTINISILVKCVDRKNRKYDLFGCGVLDKNVRHIAIIGAGNAGMSLFEEIYKNKETSFHVWCFIDDNPNLIGRKHRGVSILGPIDSLATLLRDSPVSELIIAIPSLSETRRQEILDLCSELPYTIKLLPSSLLQEVSGSIQFASSVRAVKLEDLLGRSSVSFRNDELESFISGKTVLITGAGGSIGSELTRQAAMYKPKKLILFDMIENSVYLLREELRYQYGNTLDVQIEIGTIRDERRLKGIFIKYQPEIVFHAAAHKHVPLMEHNPAEAIKNNIFGTFTLLKCAAVFNCSKFVMLSTDKAVNPTNVMGATKRFCEMMLQAMPDIPECKTEFVAVRFGNVLGSDGSVVPLFMNQIEHGGPVTLTDKRIIRYFMTISEAVSLVLTAGAMAHKSEVYVLDMGDPVKILTLAENLIRLAGLKPYVDIQIVETGLRPGEKLYEELLVSGDSNTATSKQKIFIDKQNNRMTLIEVERSLKLLNNALDTENNEIIVATLKKLVPTFKTPEEVNSSVKEVEVENEQVGCSA